MLAYTIFTKSFDKNRVLRRKEYLTYNISTSVCHIFDRGAQREKKGLNHIIQSTRGG